MKIIPMLLFAFFVSNICAQTKFYIVSKKEKSKSLTKKEIKRAAKFKKKHGVDLGGYFKDYGKSDTAKIRLSNERISKELQKYWTEDELEVIFLSKEELKEQKKKNFEKSFLLRIRYNSGKKTVEDAATSRKTTTYNPHMDYSFSSIGKASSVKLKYSFMSISNFIDLIDLQVFLNNIQNNINNSNYSFSPSVSKIGNHLNVGANDTLVIPKSYTSYSSDSLSQELGVPVLVVSGEEYRGFFGMKNYILCHLSNGKGVGGIIFYDFYSSDNFQVIFRMKKNNGTVFVGRKGYLISGDYMYAISSSNYIDDVINTLKRKILK